LSLLDSDRFGSDTFICDQFDTFIDFDLYERDAIIGPFSVEFLGEEEEEIEAIPEYDSNIFPLETEEFERLHSQSLNFSHLLPLPPPQLSNYFDMSSLSEEDHQMIFPSPISLIISMNFILLYQKLTCNL
jgi:hypothetical protein